MAEKTDQQLQDIFARPNYWTPTALEAATEELQKRNIITGPEPTPSAPHRNEMSPEHQYNSSGFCKRCGYGREFIDKTHRTCISEDEMTQRIVVSNPVDQSGTVTSSSPQVSAMKTTRGELLKLARFVIQFGFFGLMAAFVWNVRKTGSAWSGLCTWLSVLIAVAACPVLVCAGVMWVARLPNRGDAKKKKDDMNRAIADLTKAIELNPKSSGAYYNRGLAIIAKNKRDPRSGPPMFATRNKHDMNRAIADLTKAVELNPKASEAYYSRGIANFMNFNMDGALADFSKAIELNPKSVEACKRRGEIKRIKGDLAGANEDLAQASKLEAR